MKFKEYYNESKQEQNNLFVEKFISADKIKQRFGQDADPTAYINVHMNPDHNEVLEVIRDVKETDPEQYKKANEMDFVRGFFDMGGNLYIWYGTFFHDNVERFLRSQEKTSNLRKNNKFRFSWIKGDNHLTLESDWASRFFQGRDNFENNKQKSEMINKVITAFPMVKMEDGDGKPTVRTKQGLDAWVKSMGSDKDSEREKSISKKKSSNSEKQKSEIQTKDLGKVGDTIVFASHTPGMAGNKVKIIAVVYTLQFNQKKQYHYVFKSPKNSPSKHSAEKILKADNIHFIDGKENIKKENEPFTSQLSTGDFIKEIIPNPNRIEKKPDNLYTPKRKEGEETYRAYTDRR